MSAIIDTGDFKAMLEILLKAGQSQAQTARIMADFDDKMALPGLPLSRQ